MYTNVVSSTHPTSLLGLDGLYWHWYGSDQTVDSKKCPGKHLLSLFRGLTLTVINTSTYLVFVHPFLLDEDFHTHQLM